MSRPKRYIKEKEVLDTIRYWWKTAILANGQPTLCDEIRALPTADVIPLDRIKEAREEIEDRIDNYPDRNISEYEDCLAIIDKLIAEVEG